MMTKLEKQQFCLSRFVNDDASHHNEAQTRPSESLDFEVVPLACIAAMFKPPNLSWHFKPLHLGRQRPKVSDCFFFLSYPHFQNFQLALFNTSSQRAV